jgi:hypothetical protein
MVLATPAHLVRVLAAVRRLHLLCALQHVLTERLCHALHPCDVVGVDAGLAVVARAAGAAALAPRPGLPDGAQSC